MKILSFKPGHDGSSVYVSDEFLKFSHEAEKDSASRFSPLDVTSIIDSFEFSRAQPDAIAISGWDEIRGGARRKIGSGYLGLEAPEIRQVEIFGRHIKLISSSHERSHILCSYALSPFPQGVPCYALVWEGHIGRFYEIDDAMNISLLCDVMWGPGIRYAFAYGLMDPSFDLSPGAIRLSDAGKLMALAAYEDELSPTQEEQYLVSALLSNPEKIPKFSKSDFRAFSQFNCGVTSTTGKRFSRLISDAILQRFITRISPCITRKSPLLISGGCGLNCEWNSSLSATGLFSDVFVPPCANDSGSAIGTAADAQFVLTGSAKLNWSVYSGQPFVVDEIEYRDFVCTKATPADIAKYLHDGAILGWARGNAEIGPRALGNRSILASPFSKQTLLRLNQLKRRESFRPIAPVCSAEEVGEHFSPAKSSPYMLFFHQVLNPHLQAITHVDGSARVQTVTYEQNAALHSVLSEFRKLCGVGVLCNTSLNFNGTDFINRGSDLANYAREVHLDGFVIEDRLYMRKNSPAEILGETS
ncbi:3'-hydroxymethylcephem-O-carbamoyltransferase [Pandoraea communis]|uniref:3'-hydroxymethylcephem-O-carbamoyltransferase n=1 Tax=Pandoraea communis TaxID=2508297 RepID=A0A5E4Z1R3_9BURK|nr:carbamoyltransferase C-terminal domain-containing protein [Pandoraea communis]VVE54260.1 3'-hydroxymethylcephem-O-carbamoyltransferase [Pandoraea communis]